MFELLQHEDAGALAHHETVAILVKGATGSRGIVIAGAQSLHCRETGNPEGRDRGFGATGHANIRFTALNHVHCITHRVCRGCASGSDRVVRALQVVRDRDQTGCDVGDHLRNHKRRAAARPTLNQRAVLMLDSPESANAGADNAAHAFGVHFLAVECRIIHRLLGCYQGKMAVAVHTPLFFAVDILADIEVCYLGSNRNREIRGVETLDLANAGASSCQAVPEALGS